jgi:predicted small lipoprotein YifL
MKLKFSGLLLVVTVVLFTACSKKGPSYTRYIPKEASYVLALDVKGLVSKLQKDSLSVENLLEVLKDSSNPSQYAKAIGIWSDFKDAGLDLDNKFFVAVPAADFSSGSINVEVIAGLKDAKKLEAFVLKSDSGAKVVKDGDISYVIHNEAIVGWNSDAVVIIGGASSPKNFYNNSAPAPAPVPGSGFGLAEKLKKYFALKKEESITSVDEFNKLIAEKADVAIFTNSSSLASGSANPALAVLPKVKDLLQGIYSSTLINFEDGKIEFKSNTFFGAKLADILKKYAGPTVDLNLIEAYPGSNVDGVTAFSFNPELIPALLKETGFDALADLSLSQAGVTSADIVKAFKGDFAIVFSDFTIQPVTKSYGDQQYTSTQPTGKLVFAARINDKAALDKIVAVGTKGGFIVKQGNRLLPASGGVPQNTDKLAIGIENDLLVFSNDENTYKAYVAKTGKNDISAEAKSSIKGSSVAFYIDALKLLNGIPETLFDSTQAHEKNIFNKSKEVFKTFDFTTGNFDGKKLEGHGEVILAKDKNSLSQLVQFLLYTAQEFKLQQAEREVSYKPEEEKPGE